MAAKKTAEEEPTSEKLTFTVTPIDIIPMNKKLQEQAFLRDLKIDIHWLGGVFKQTYGVTVTGDSAKVGEFVDWGNEHRTDIEHSALI